MDSSCKVHFGDNLAYMKTLADGSIDFIYVDPPFFSAADYYTRKGKAAYGDRWSGGLDQYLAMLKPRLEEMRRLLKDSGTIAVHLDWHAVHYVKVMMDGIFGMNNFLNEIIWAYKSGGATGRRFARKHDTILVYAKTDGYYFRTQKERSYNRDNKPYHFKGVEEFQDEEGKWYTMVNKKDVLFVDMVGRTSSERTDYATQKPQALLDILLESLCPENGLCADFFAGSGTLGACALESGRECLLCDSSREAVDTILDRLGMFVREV